MFSFSFCCFRYIYGRSRNSAIRVLHSQTQGLVSLCCMTSSLFDLMAEILLFPSQNSISISNLLWKWSQTILCLLLMCIANLHTLIDIFMLSYHHPSQKFFVVNFLIHRAITLSEFDNLQWNKVYKTFKAVSMRTAKHRLKPDNNRLFYHHKALE